MANWIPVTEQLPDFGVPPSAPSDCHNCGCRQEWAGGEKCATGACEFAYGVDLPDGGQQK